MRARFIVLMALVPMSPLAGSPQSCGVDCGSYRWGVKTLADADKQNVNLTSTKTSTVAETADVGKAKERG